MTALDRIARSAGLALAIVLAGCAYPTRNQIAARYDIEQGYRLQNLVADDADDDTLVIVTASGGGTRATALTLSVLRALESITMPDGRSLADDVDVISSVSGGSVAAAYFALEGSAGFDTLDRDFIARDGISALLVDGLNPVGLARLSTHGEERIDLLIDYFDRQLFHGATYGTLLQHKRPPLLLLNAADMVEGVPFTFTQRNFDLLCSDLTAMPLATAVAASAAFPVALSPVTLVNYHGEACPATDGRPGWPPPWVASSPAALSDPALWYANPEETTMSRVEYAYATGVEKRFIHLLDGGIADNLGIFEPLRMLTTRRTDPSFLTRIGNERVRKLVFIVVNARSAASSTLDQSQATPGILDMLRASIYAPIDRATAGTAERLRSLLHEEFRNLSLDDPEAAARFHRLEANTALISIDFDAIAQERCRQRFHDIPTSWSLSPEDATAVRAIGGALLAADPDFANLVRITGATVPAFPTVDAVCAAAE